jgi:hypothetical protein
LKDLRLQVTCNGRQLRKVKTVSRDADRYAGLEAELVARADDK